jgi:hypothetical protein
MGFLASLDQLNEQATEIDKAAGPMDQRLNQAMAQMQQAQVLLAQQTAVAQAAVDPAAVAAEGQVIAVRDAGVRVNMDPTLEVDLLVTLPGQPPYPVTTRAVVSVAHLGRVTAGATLAVRVNPATPHLVQLVLAAV